VSVLSITLWPLNTTEKYAPGLIVLAPALVTAQLYGEYRIAASLIAAVVAVAPQRATAAAARSNRSRSIFELGAIPPRDRHPSQCAPLFATPARPSAFSRVHASVPVAPLFSTLAKWGAV